MSKEKKKEPKKGLWKFYSIDKESMTVKFLGRKCSRCGAMMALHKEGRVRWSCGQCRYTEYT